MGSSKYHIKTKSSKQIKCTGTPKEPPLIGKGKIVLMLISGTAVVAGIYMTALQLHFAPIMPIYWTIAGILLMIFLYFNTKNEYLYTKMTTGRTPSEEEKKDFRQRTKKLKYLLIVLLPFLFTLIGDMVYLYFLKDLDILGAIKNLM